MGQSSSNERRRRSGGYPHPQPQLHYTSPPPPPPPPPAAAATSYPYAPNPPYYPNPYPPPPPPTTYNTNSYSYQLVAGYISLIRFVDSLIGGGRISTQGQGQGQGPYNQQQQHYDSPYYPYYAPNHANLGWVPSPAPAPAPPPSSSSMPMPMMPQFVEQQQAKTVKNDVNVHKDTIRLEIDEHNPDHYLVSFVFDALVDGSVTVYYFAQEGTNGELFPVYADVYTPKRFPFQKGLGQKFCQPSGSGIDLGFFELDDLSKPSAGDVFPLVIYAEACPHPLPTDEIVGQCAAATCAQITQAVIHKASDESFQAKSVRQVLWANGERYELQEIFGLVDSAETEAEPNEANADDMGKDCVICLSEPRNTAVLPCRHMCMCSECAKALRLQSNKCPICRQPVEKLMEINVNRADH